MDFACPKCKGRRLSDTVLGVTVGGLNIDEICRLSIDKMLKFIDGLTLGESEAKIAAERRVRAERIARKEAVQAAAPAEKAED